MSNEVDSEHSSHILTNMCGDEEFRDIELIAEDDNSKYRVHRLVMISSSNYFSARLGRNFNERHVDEVSIPDIDGRTLKSIIDFCYTGKILITDENILPIISAASSMEFVRVEKKCEQFWIRQLTASNCIELFMVADKYFLSDLRKKSFDLICENFEAATVAEKLQEFDVRYFTELLKCDVIHAREDSIFQRLVQWANHDEENRSKHIPDLFKLIRLGRITKLILLDCVENFARKYNCLDLVMNEYRKRMTINDRIPQPYRHTKIRTKFIHAITFSHDIASIHTYDSVVDMWKRHSLWNVRKVIEISNCGFLFAEGKCYFIDCVQGKMATRMVKYQFFESIYQAHYK